MLVGVKSSAFFPPYLHCTLPCFNNSKKQNAMKGGGTKDNSSENCGIRGKHAKLKELLDDGMRIWVHCLRDPTLAKR
jgi:hypothetical protein